MHNLRAYMGDELFRTAMTAMQTNHMYEDVTPEQFRDYLEEASGLELNDFFDDQVFQSGFSGGHPGFLLSALDDGPCLSIVKP